MTIAMIDAQEQNGTQNSTFDKIGNEKAKKKDKKDSQDVININANTNFTLAALNNNYEANTNVSSAEMQLATSQAQAQAALANLFESVENASTGAVPANPYGWTNNLAQLKALDPTSSTYATQVQELTTAFNADQTSYNSDNQLIGASETQLNTDIGQDAQTNQTADTGIGGALITGAQNLTSMMMKG